MAKLNRFTMPVFAGNAAQSQTSVFGTMKTSPQYTTDVAASIGTTAYGNGWSDAIEVGYAPYMEDMNTLQRAITYQISYNQQQGIPEWASDTEYYNGSVVKLNTANGMQIYSSLVDNNVGNLVSDNTKWKLLIDSANSYVTTNTTQTISGVKTFSSSPVVPTATTGDSSTKAASTEFVTDAINTINNAVVHLTGDETIGGVKTFNNPIHFKSSVFVDDASGDEGGEIEFAKAPNSSLTANIHLDSWKNSMRIFGWDSNNVNILVFRADIEENAVFVPSSDKINAAISTVGINKSSDGYVKLGNGIIIQWGRSSTTDGYVTFPTPFSNACTAVIPSRISSGDALSNIFENASTTGFKIKIDGGYSSSAYFYWIAVGY